jgi:hypothetical protein
MGGWNQPGFAGLLPVLIPGSPGWDAVVVDPPQSEAITRGAKHVYRLRFQRAIMPEKFKHKFMEVDYA